MPSVASKLQGIVSDTKRALDLCQTLQKENDALRLEVQSLKVALETSLQKNKDFEAEIKALAIAKTLDGADTPEETAGIEGSGAINEKILDTKRKINDFVREIDKCIELLR